MSRSSCPEWLARLPVSSLRGLSLTVFSTLVVLIGATFAFRVEGQTADGDMIDPGSSSGYSTDVVSPMHPNDGTVTRKMIDLKIPNSPDGLLNWVRYSDTRRRSVAGDVFGPAGTWRHNWQYTLVAVPTVNGNGTQLDFVYPSGIAKDFVAVPGGGWTGVYGVFEGIAVAADGIDVTTPSGARLHFVSQVDSKNATQYRLQQVTDPYGATVQLSYTAGGDLQTVTDSVGNSLTLTYRDIQIQTIEKVRLGTAAAQAGPQQIAVPVALQSQVFSAVRIRQKGPVAMNLANAQVYAPGETKPLVGRPIGSNRATGSKQKPTTTMALAFTGVLGSDDWCGFSFSRHGGSQIGSITLTLSPGFNGTLAPLIIEAQYPQIKTVRVLASVTASSGETVNYDYDIKTKPALKPKFNPAGFPPQALLAFAGVRYADGTQAHYRYAQVVPGTRASLVEADDPRYAGRVRHVKLAYRADPAQPDGMISQITDAATGQVAGALDVAAADPLNRIIHLPGGRTRSYELSTAGLGLITSATDEAGRTTTYGFDVSGRLQMQSDASGTMCFGYDGHNRIATVQRGQAPVRQYQRDEQGRVTQVIDEQSRATAYVRGHDGRLVSINYPDGSRTTYAYDALGRVTLAGQRDGSIRLYQYDAQGHPTVSVAPAASLQAGSASQ